MGTDKAFLELAGKSLISRAIELAREVSQEVMIIGDPQKFASYGDAIPDIFPGSGPLAGIHAALTASRADWNFILAVDLPFLNAAFLKYMLDQAQSSRATVTVALTGGFYHPLCAIYRKQFATLAGKALSAGRNKIDALFNGVQLRTVTEEELAAHGFDASIFRNLNTREGWEQAQREFTST